MARPPAVDGGRPHRVTVRYSDTEIEALDNRRGPLNRVEYIRRQTARPSTPGERAVPVPQTVLDDHVHLWSRQTQYLDICGCGAERPHQAGTK